MQSFKWNKEDIIDFSALQNGRITLSTVQSEAWTNAAKVPAPNQCHIIFANVVLINLIFFKHKIKN